MTRPTRTWDAAVVGAGPAGSMAALELARAGASVLLLDRQPFPRWKVCGSCLSAGTREVLRSAGLEEALDALRPAPLHTLRLAGWGARADLALGPSVAVGRKALDAALARAAREAGAVFRAPARARLGPTSDAARTLLLEGPDGPEVVEARVVVVADGVGSPLLARALGPGTAPGAPADSRIGFGALFPHDTPGYPPGIIHMAVGTGGYVGAVRLEDGSLDVGAALDPARPGDGTGPRDLVDRLLAEAGFPPLPGTALEGWQGTPRLTRRPATRGAYRLLAVGDAAGYVEPFTGEGVGWALSGGRAVAPLALEGIRGWDPGIVERWDRAYEEGVGAAARLCRGISWALRRPALSRVGMGVVRRLPFLATPLVRRAARAPAHPTWGTP